MIAQLLKIPQKKWRPYSESPFRGLLKNVQKLEIWVNIGRDIQGILKASQSKDFNFVRFLCHRQGKKVQYLGPLAINWKNKDILLSQTLKVEEKKVSLIFYLWLRTLSFLQLLKFEKAKYPYIFNLWPRGRDIELFSLDDGTYSSSWGSKERNGHISAPGPQIKKLRTRSFLQLLKFEKAKCPYFFHLWPRGRDMAIFSIWNLSPSMKSNWKPKCASRQEKEKVHMHTLSPHPNNNPRYVKTPT